jgi:hypothetical protein
VPLPYPASGFPARRATHDTFGPVVHGRSSRPVYSCRRFAPAELLVYLRDSFATLNKSLSALTVKNMYDPIEGPYGGPNTRLGLAEVCIWHAADHCGQMAIYLRLAGIIPPSSRPNPPPLSGK